MAKTQVRGGGVRIQFDDQVSSKLFALSDAAGKESLDRVLGAVSMMLKAYITKEIDTNFTQREGNMAKGLKYRKQRAGRFQLKAKSIYSVHETGAYITPKNAKALRFFGNSGEFVFAKAVRIPKRPFVKPGLRAAISQDAINKTAMASIDLEIKRLGLKI